ncbi:MAG: threonine ammonia-lyase [Thaumarchaeota archaeon]|nr:threonine ammonia-lyase [Nitrososphaerota archaeon]
MSEQEVSFSDIERATDVLKDVVRRTPLDSSRILSEMTGSDVLLKLENLQRTGSFKIRGAYLKISSLSDSERKRGVVAASAGNHAQGVAHAATLLETRSTIIMPEGASPAKIDATKAYGAKVVLHGRVFDDSLEMAKQISRKEDATFVHPFDDPTVIAGQGTVGLEMMEDQSELDVVMVPIGGGGLISGVATAVKAMKTKVRVVGVQSEAFPSMYMAFKTGKLVPFRAEDTIADGIAVKQPGKLTYKLVKKYVDDVVLVNDAQIAEAIFLMLERLKLVVEPAGAAAVAASIAGLVKARGEKCGVVVTGGNIDMYILDQIVAKVLEKERRLLRLRFTLSDRPGALKEVVDLVAQARANIINVQHERMGQDVPIGRTQVIFSLETQNEEHTRNLIDACDRARLRYKVIS